jgi:soluble lytic murein transglycosylase-like protein
VTSSEQALRAAFATKPRVRQFDAVFERYRGELPIEYVRALVERESDGFPAARAGSAIGLMQIVPVVLADYNKRHGKAIRSEQLVAPAVNVAIGCDLLRLIIASYRKHHPRIPSLQADWNNPRFVELLTLGWNAGFSEAGGLGRVARYLEQLGARDIDVDLVAAHARLAGATKHLSNPAKLAWSKSVVALYQRERALARTVFVSS